MLFAHCHNVHGIAPPVHATCLKQLNMLTFYEKDDKETVESMEFINILNIDIKEVKAKELDVTYEFDPSLDSSSELGLKSVFCSDFTSH